MKKIIDTLVVFGIMLLLISCQSKPKIGLLIDNLNAERWKKDMSLLETKINELGGTSIKAVAESNSEKQLTQAIEMIEQGVNVIIVIPTDLVDACEIVKVAHANGVPVISYDRMIQNCSLDYYISTDNIAVGELQANYLTKIKPEGKYGIIGGATSDYNSYLLNLGHMNILQPLVDRGDIEIVLHQYTHSWSKEEAYEILHNYLESGTQDIDAIIAGNDDMAAGVIEALKEVHLEGKVLLAGQDADRLAVQNIVAGNQTITIYKPIESMAYAAAYAAIKIADGEAPSNMNLTVNNGKRLVPSILLKPQVVNKQNIKMTLVAPGHITEEEIKNMK